MKTLHVAGGAFVTGSEMADAVMRFGLELARAERLDLVDIPLVGTDGSVSRVQVVIGWRIDMIVTSRLDDPDDDPLDVETLFAVLDRTRELQGPHAARD